jgi:two-component system CheB/CheR fusion protein
MKARRTDPLRGLAAYLDQRRASVTQRWAEAVHAEPGLQQALTLTADQLIDHVPEIYAEVIAALKIDGRAEMPLALERNVRLHGHFRWTQGYRLDELFQEMDLLRQIMQDAVADYFAQEADHPRTFEAQAQRTVQDLFSAMVQSSIVQVLEDQERRIGASLDARDRAQAAERNSKERLRIAADAAGLGIFEWDLAERRALWENARMYEITGQRPEDGPLSGEEFTQVIVHPDDASGMARDFDSGKVSGGQVHTVFRIFRRGDSALRVLQMSGRFQFGDDGVARCFIGALADITDRKKADDALQEADRQKDVFVATLAHELRNPLAPIRAGAHAMKHYQAALPAQIQWVQQVIERQSRHLSSLLDDLLDVSRIRTGRIKLKKNVCALREVITAAIETNRPLADARRQQLTASLPAEPVFVNGDSTRLTQVVSNLLDNAIKYTADGGEVRLSGNVMDDHVLISVEDTGIGIEATMLPHVFDLLVQADPLMQDSQSGLGLGLWVARSVIELHGGEISATSAGPGKGSRFTVRLPVVPAPLVQAAESEAVAHPGSRRLRILIIDDHRDGADSLALVLRMEEHDVRTAQDGPSGLQAANAWSPDVILLDIGLPGMSGYDVAHELRALPETRDSVLIALSGFGGDADISRSTEAGFTKHLVKPVDPDQLIQTLRDIGRVR